MISLALLRCVCACSCSMCSLWLRRSRLSLPRSVLFFCKQKTAYEMRISDWSSDVCSSDLFHDDLDRLTGLCRRRILRHFGNEGLQVLLRLKEWLGHGPAEPVLRNFGIRVT